MQPNIAIKIAEYEAWILLSKHCKMYCGQKYYSCRDRNFSYSIIDHFLVHPVYFSMHDAFYLFIY